MMRLLLLAGIAVWTYAQPLALMPMPAKITQSSGVLLIDSSFQVALKGYDEPRLDRAAQRLLERLSKQTGMRMLNAKSAKPALTISCEHKGDAVQALGEDESYRLTVDAAGAHLSSVEPLGVLRGIETFLQLVQPGAHGFGVPAVTIEDHPRFPWRGLSYDVARHFMPLGEVERTLDGMAAVKLNVFHWHLSDNQGFRVESKLFPRLQEVGSGGQFYTQAQIREIVDYARDRGIRVIPEFDIPGHATAMLVAYPSLATSPAPKDVDHTFGVLDAVMDPTNPAVYTFLDRFIGEMAGLFPDAYFHIGGDEVNGKLWRESAKVRAFKAAEHYQPSDKDPDSNIALHAFFNRKLERIVEKHGKHMEGWDEILTPDLPKSILVQSWRGQKSLAAGARLGYRGILSAGYYLDLEEPASQHYLVDPMDMDAGNLTPDEQARILGGEAAMWSEMVTPETIDSRIWPRLAVVAERLWSPREVRDVPDMYRRMEVISGWLGWLGLTHRSWQEPMLVRLVGEHDPEPLRVLAAFVEPVKEYERERFGPYTTETPLIGLVDSVPPESEGARRFAGMVHTALERHTGFDMVREQLLVLRANHSRLQPIFKNNEWLSGVEPVSQAVSDLAAMGLAAIQAIESGEKSDAQWRKKQTGRITELSAPHAAVYPAFAGAVLELVDAASQ